MSAVVMVGVLVAAVGWWARRNLVYVTVSGPSMQPSLYDGDRLLVRRRKPHQLRRGDIVVVEAPAVRIPVDGVWRCPVPGRQVKRVAALAGEPLPPGVPDPTGSGHVPAGTLVVLSDNRVEGVDSRSWGPYPGGGLVGVMLLRTHAARTETNQARAA